MSELVSIALCTYNGSGHLRQQLDSIINQTYTHLEIIAVDDCSTDDTYAILQEYAAQDSRIKCYLNEHNLGFNKNFEKALTLTQGQYIALADQDDIWELHKIQTLLNHIGSNWLIFSNSAYIDEHGNPTGRLLLNDFSLAQKTFVAFIMQNYVTGHTTLMRRELLKYILPLPANGFYDWWIGFIAIYLNQLTYVDAVLTRYREHEQSVIRQMRGDEEVKAIENLVRSIQRQQLQSQLTNPHLAAKDRKLIKRFMHVLSNDSKRWPALSSIRLIYKYYPVLFPDIKQRTGLSKFNFAVKYLTGRL